MIEEQQTMTRNRVSQLAQKNGWDADRLWAEIVLKHENSNVSFATVKRLYQDPNYMGSVKSLEAVARVLGLRYTDMVEDV
jgi:hypothetical protein